MHQAFILILFQLNVLAEEINSLSSELSGYFQICVPPGLPGVTASGSQLPRNGWYRPDS